MSSRKSIYLTDKSEKIIGPVESRSGRINFIIDKYNDFINDNAPELTLAEWSILCEALNGRKIDASTEKYLWADIHNKTLAGKIREMSPAARCYIIDTVYWFCKTHTGGIKPTNEALKDIGAKIAGD